MKLASLAQKYSDMVGPPEGADSDEYYPSLHLDEKQIDAIGVTEARVGKEMMMTALVRVASFHDAKNGARSMSFEVIEAGLSDKEDSKDAATVLFPNEKG
jgi:hypothetical protein